MCVVFLCCAGAAGATAGDRICGFYDDGDLLYASDGGNCFGTDAFRKPAGAGLCRMYSHLWWKSYDMYDIGSACREVGKTIGAVMKTANGLKHGNAL